MNKECIYVTFDNEEYKYYIGKGQVSKIEDGYIGSSQYKNDEGLYDGPNKDKHEEQDTWDPNRWFTAILATFKTEDEAYAAETDVQIAINAKDDPDSYNMSNDSFRKGSQAKKSLFNIFRPSTWWGSDKSTGDTSLSSDQIKNIVRYIKDIEYHNPIKFNLITTNSGDISEVGQDIMRVDLIQFQNQSRKDCEARGKTIGLNGPNQDKFDQELGILAIELNGQLDSRVFNLEQDLVSHQEELKHLPKQSKKFIEISKLVIRIEHEVNHIETKIREKWLEIVTAAFTKGYIDGIDESQ